MIIKHYIKNNEKRYANGLIVSVVGMTLEISNGGFVEEGTISILVPDIYIDFIPEATDRDVRVYLVNDTNEPIKCVEEFEKADVGMDNLLCTLASFKIPANCNDLATITIDVWEYTDEEITREVEYEPKPIEPIL